MHGGSAESGPRDKVANLATASACVLPRWRATMRRSIVRCSVGGLTRSVSSPEAARIR